MRSLSGVDAENSPKPLETSIGNPFNAGFEGLVPDHHASWSSFCYFDLNFARVERKASKQCQLPISGKTPATSATALLLKPYTLSVLKKRYERGPSHQSIESRNSLVFVLAGHLSSEGL